MADNMIKSTAAGMNDKMEINIASITQIVKKVEKENNKIKSAPIKTVVTNAAKMKTILSSELDLGVKIAAFDTMQKPKIEDKSER